MDLAEWKKIYEKVKPTFDFSKAKRSVDKLEQRKAREAKDDQAKRLTSGAQRASRCMQCTRPLRNGICIHCDDSDLALKEKTALQNEVESRIRHPQISNAEFDSYRKRKRKERSQSISESSESGGKSKNGRKKEIGTTQNNSSSHSASKKLKKAKKKSKSKSSKRKSSSKSKSKSKSKKHKHK
uniref:Uncharacterized protein n=1 Tax=Aplanochytrium stocchinoi TaxID=215587 RepID=A0A7S3LS33_9STRA|mmetsp:Transcript_4098/g.5151  ORF Transcript_4098/g.5151 Transcript_4098/m.5151 type:complete len:183 (+) Transcript_4098:199-747(+)